MAVKIQPLGDRVVVKPLEKEEKTKGGIFCLIQQRKNRRRAKCWQ